MKFLSRGYTYVEVLLVIGIFAILVSITTIGFPKIAQKTSVETTVTTLIAGIKDQQLKAILGSDNEDQLFLPFGVNFQSDQYTFFRGNSYPGQNMFPVQLSTPLQLSNTFPGNTIIFTRKSGEIQGFVSGQDSVTITNTASGDTKTIQFNKMGVVVSLN